MLFGEGVTQFCVVRKPPLRKTCDEDEEGLGRGAQVEKKGDVGPRGTHHFEDRVTFKMEQVLVVGSPVVTVSAPCLQKINSTYQSRRSVCDDGNPRPRRMDPTSTI